MNKEQFLDELKNLGIEITSKQFSDLEKYYEIMIEYNTKVNLTRIVEKEEVYLKHFYDSLTLFKFEKWKDIKSVCDMGTGAGFPGMVIKIIFPEIEVTLVDSLNKRIKFLEQVKEELNLEKLNIYHSRIEDYSRLNEEKFDLVVSRAVTNISNMLEMSIRAVKNNKYTILMKGNISRENINIIELEKKLNIKQTDIINFELPNNGGERTFFCFKKIKSTPKLFPRKYEILKKNPI